MIIHEGLPDEMVTSPKTCPSNVRRPVEGRCVAVATSQGDANHPTATQRPSTGRLTLDGHVLGEVTISSGNPSWMIMDVDAGKLSGLVWCEVTFTNGRSETVGKFTISHDYGSWVAPIKASGSDVRSARIVNKNGTVLAQATFTT